MTLQDRLDNLAEQFGSVGAMAKAIGVSDNAVYKWLQGRGQPTVKNLVALAGAANVSIEWLATGAENAGGPRPGTTKRPVGRSFQQGDFVFLPRHDVKGPTRGGPISSNQVVDVLAFKADWVRNRLGTEPRNLMLIEAVGDAMTPTIRHSDLLLVDLGEPRFRHDGIYAMRRNEDLMVKRVQRRPDGSLLVKNDNPAYESGIATAENLRTIGRVIWIASRV
jgi:phage repressor protein C with HTH and peptisase S24 domain